MEQLSFPCMCEAFWSPPTKFHKMGPGHPSQTVKSSASILMQLARQNVSKSYGLCLMSPFGRQKALIGPCEQFEVQHEVKLVFSSTLKT